MITQIFPRPRPLTTVAEATSLASLNAVGWRVVAGRPTCSDQWLYTDGILKEFAAFVRLRDLGAITLVQRRDVTDAGEQFTLLAKVAEAQAKAWSNLLARELGRS